MHEDGALLLAVLESRQAGVVIRVAEQANLGQLPAEVLHPLDLLGGRDGGHEDRRFDSQLGAGEGDALGVVAGAGADDAALALLSAQ